MVLEALQTAGSAISNELAALADRVRPSVVEVRTRRGAGTGIVWSSDGLIITNNHVVGDDHAQVTLADGDTVTGTVEDRAPMVDLAALRIPRANLVAVDVGDSSTLRVGQLVVAVGNPFGLPRALTLGIISTSVSDGQARLQWEAVVHSGVELRPGNSGGPLLDAAGRVVGINTMVAGPRRALSIPSQTVVAFVSRTMTPPRLGVTVQVARLPAPLDLGGQILRTGLLVTAVDDGAPADQAGLLPGDILLVATFSAADGTTRHQYPLLEPADLAWLLMAIAPEMTIDFLLLRGGAIQHRQATPQQVT